MAWFLTKFRPYSIHFFNLILSKSDKSCTSDDEIKKLAEQVRNDMEHIRQAFKILNENIHGTYMASNDNITMLDLVVYNEIS